MGSNPGKIHRSGAPSVELWELCQMVKTAAHSIFGAASSPGPSLPLSPPCGPSEREKIAI